MSNLSHTNTHRVEIDAVALGGMGVGRINGVVCFVPSALPGDVAEVWITRSQQRYVMARLTQLLEASPHRTQTPGDEPVHGGALWLHFAYPAQAEWKRRLVEESLRRIGRIEVDAGWAELPELRHGYRTRATYHGNGGRWGFYAFGSHEIVPMQSCPLCHERLNAAFSKLRGLDASGEAELTVNPEGDAVLAWSRTPLPGFQERFPRAQNLSSPGPRASFLFDGVPVVNGAFSQSSLLLNRLLRSTVRTLVGQPGSVLDLYCGSGNLSLQFTAEAEVLGLDQNRAAIDAVSVLGKGDYRCGGYVEFRTALHRHPWDAVILDPPRMGAKPLLDALGNGRAGAMVYVSCDPATLARDLKALVSHGWKVVQVIALDLFPHAAHVETVCRLERG